MAIEHNVVLIIVRQHADIIGAEPERVVDDLLRQVMRIELGA